MIRNVLTERLLARPWHVFAGALVVASLSSDVRAQNVGAARDLVAATENGFVHWRASASAGQVLVVEEPLRQSEAQLEARGRRSWSVDALVVTDWIDSWSVLPRPDQRSLVALSLHGGAARSVYLSWLNKSTAGKRDPMPAYRLDQVMLSDLDDTGDGGPFAFDLADPVLFEWRGATFLLASAFTTLDPALCNNRRIVLVQLPRDPFPAHALMGPIVGRGAQPRLVADDQELLVAAREPENAQEALGEAAVAFHRSSDGVTWMEDPELSGGARAISSYSVVNAAGS